MRGNGHTEVDYLTDVRAQGLGHDHGGDAAVREVDDEHGHGRDDRYGQLVPPPDVEHVVQEAEQRRGVEGQQRRQVRRQLRRVSACWHGERAAHLLVGELPAGSLGDRGISRTLRSERVRKEKRNEDDEQQEVD